MLLSLHLFLLLLHLPPPTYGVGGPVDDEPHRWSYGISSGHGGGPVDNPIQVISLSKRQRLERGVDTAYVCIRLHIRGKEGSAGGVREQWMPSCFSVHDARWARSVVSVGSGHSATDVEITGWSSGLATITWRANTRIGVYNSPPDADVVSSIEQEIVEFAGSYKASNFFERDRLFRIISPKHAYDYPPGTVRLQIETQVVNVESFRKVIGDLGSVCTSLVHVPSGRENKACFPVKDNSLVPSADNSDGKVAFAWAKDHADLGPLTGEFVFRIFGIDAGGVQVNRGARSRFMVLPGTPPPS